MIKNTEPKETIYIIAFVLNLRIFPIIYIHISIILYYLFSEIIVREGSEFLVSCNKSAKKLAIM